MRERLLRSSIPTRGGAALALLLLAGGVAPPAAAVAQGDGPDAGKRPPATFSEVTAGLVRRDGLLPLYFDGRRGKLLLELPASSAAGGLVGEYLYVEGLASGLGSNPVGLDRGQIGRTRVVALRRLGGRLLVEELNQGFRALTDDEDERRAARQSFATSVLWAGELLATAEDGRAVVDITPFVVRDAHGTAATLARSGQGSYTLDEGRSAIDLDACLAFPENLELESLLTFRSDSPGPEVRGVAPSGQWVSLVQHQTLARLPDAGYQPRAFDPRSGSSGVAFLDYAAPLEAPVRRAWLVRHRLEKTDPAAARSTVVEPIVYYVDRGAPEPIRSALVEGASWWAEAFAAAGFIDAFRVELLPPGVHPLDLRYNVIQWVHRSTRGWSYGGGVVDPRTGEIVKGHVSLGSLRVRQDRLIFEGLLGTDKTGSGAPDDPIQLALARIRQLAAHEVGHTLGLDHNFAASTYGRASVMDYPAPWIRLTPQGELDTSQAYATGVGEWDVQAIRYAYGQAPPGTDEATMLSALLADGLRRGLNFLTDEDARPPGAANPLANLWDNGSDPVAQLEQEMAIRELALSRFGERSVRPGEPLALLEEVLATVYFRHRYQLEAAVKTVGGLDYRYSLRGDGQPGPTPVAGERQRHALQVILGLLEPARLDLPETVLAVLPPRSSGYGPSPEQFGGAAAPAFDPLSAAATAADLVVGGLLQPQRAQRLVDFHRRDPSLPGLDEVLAALIDGVFAAPAPSGRLAEIQRVTRQVVVERLLGLARDSVVPATVRSRVEWRLDALAATLGRAGGGGDEEDRATASFLRDEIRRHQARTAGAEPPRDIQPPPPGQPIGQPAAALPDLGSCSRPEP